MDNTATLALWDSDGVSLLPQTDPIVGKKAITAFLEKVTAQIAGSKMEQFEMQCFGIQISGTSATEWCDEHQIVQLAGDKKFNGHGRMLLVLRRGADGSWRIVREMWQPGAVAR
jgi:ketosteroid isomerase-like protein